jgi:rhomboid protease GluP
MNELSAEQPTDSAGPVDNTTLPSAAQLPFAAMDSIAVAADRIAPNGGDVRIVAKRKSFGSILLLALVGLCIVAELPKQVTFAAVFLVPMLLASLVMSLWKYVRPPSLSIEDDEFVLWYGQSLSSRASNVQEVLADGRKLRIRFARIEDVIPARKWSQFDRTFERTGFHFELTGAPFSLEQVNDVRTRLGLVPQATNPAADHRMQFNRQLMAQTPTTFVYKTLIVVNLLVFAYMSQDGQSPSEWTVWKLRDFGANYGPFTTQGQWTRLVSAAFLHFGFAHLLMNMWVLALLGKHGERLLGNAGFLIVYFFSAIAGSLASMLWQPYAVAAGASGAVFGILGALTVIFLRNRREIPAELFREHRNGIFAFLCLNFLLGMTAEGIDNAAHLGGFLAGCVGGLVFASRTVAIQGRSRVPQVAIVGMLGAAMLAGAVMCVPKINVRMSDELDYVDQDEATGEERLHTAIAKLHSGEFTPAQCADEIRDQVAKPWQHANQHVRALANMRVDDEPCRRALSAYLNLRLTAMELAEAGIREENSIKEGQALEKIDEGLAILQPHVSPQFGQYIATRLAGPLEPPAELARFASIERRLLDLFSAIDEQYTSGTMSGDEYAAVIDGTLLASWRNLTARLKTLESRGGRISIKWDRMFEYLDARDKNWAMFAQAHRRNDPALREQAIERWREINENLVNSATTAIDDGPSANDGM